MDDRSTVRFNIASTDPSVDLALTIYLDKVSVFTTPHVAHDICYQHEFEDIIGEHEFELVMSNKTAEHTQCDEDGNIVKDVMLSVQFSIDDVNQNSAFEKHTVYTHDFNGSQPEIQDTFHGFMGCNGRLSLKFTTPLFLWILATNRH
jgi:hypothetical protein